MKQLTCEMCGSTDLMKQDGVFVCQTCGCKYSVEEAKKMMVEGTVQIVGTVKIDDSDSYGKYVDLAKDAFDDSRYESAYDYSSKALNINADSPEIILLLGLSLFGKEEFGRAIPTGCTNAVEAYLEKMSSLEWTPETTKEFMNAKQYLASVCRYKIAGLQSNIDEIKIDLKPTRGAWDVFADLSRPAFVASQNQAEDKRIEMHNKQVQAKIDSVQQKINTITRFQNQSISKMDTLADTKKKEAAKKRFDEYWAKHKEERKQFELEQQKLNLDKDGLEQQFEALTAVSDDLQNQIQEIDAEISVLQVKRASIIFNVGAKKALQAQIDEAEQKKAKCKEALQREQEAHSEQIEQYYKRKDEITQRLAEIQAEFDKER